MKKNYIFSLFLLLSVKNSYFMMTRFAQYKASHARHLSIVHKTKTPTKKTTSIQTHIRQLESSNHPAPTLYKLLLQNNTLGNLEKYVLLEKTLPLLPNQDFQDLQHLLHLLEHNSSYDNPFFNQKRTCLHHAVIAQRISLVQSILEHTKDCNLEQKDYLSNTALYYAALSVEKEILQLLLDHHANPNSRNEFGRTPLIGAVKPQKPLDLLHHVPQVVKVLQQKGANAHLADETGKTAYDYVLTYLRQMNNNDDKQFFIDTTQHHMKLYEKILSMLIYNEELKE